MPPSQEPSNGPITATIGRGSETARPPPPTDGQVGEPQRVQSHRSRGQVWGQHKSSAGRFPFESVACKRGSGASLTTNIPVERAVRGHSLSAVTTNPRQTKKDRVRPLGRRPNVDLHRFLAIADGVVRAQGRKIIFTTNLPSVGDIDDALVRPGAASRWCAPVRWSLAKPPHWPCAWAQFFLMPVGTRPISLAAFYKLVDDAGAASAPPISN